MKKKCILCAVVLSLGNLLHAQVASKDSMKTIQLQDVEVLSTRATQKTPVAFTNLTKKEIQKRNAGKDIPFLLSITPSVLTTSDAGAGIGYSSIRVRGTDATRINITANGVPMNDAESQSIFWVNTPDLASSLKDIQVQRGVGTSTNGSGAFGATINLQTEGISAKPYTEISGSYGAFNTHKENIKVGTGILKNHWAFDARLSNIQSDGYRDRATSDLKSYFLQAGYFGEKTTLKFITFGGKEKTYHAWDGISKEQLKSNRTFNPNGKIEDAKGNIIGFYDDQFDNYRQTHYHLVYKYKFNNALNFDMTLHYTDGEGYYQEYKNDRALVQYGLVPFIHDGKTVEESDLIRQKWVNSGFGGAVYSLNYKKDKIEASIGGSSNYYHNKHHGEVIWAKSYVGDLEPNQEYYRNTSIKKETNLYAKANYQIIQPLSIYADLQYRFINYRINGRNDNWDWTKTPGEMQKLSINDNFNFFNPKIGAFSQINKYNSVYASFAIGQKEPTRNNYTDANVNQIPKSEKLFDYELGYTYQNRWFSAAVNLYYMDYTDQLVLNGKLNEIGEPMAENVKDSYRTGIELSLGAKLTKWLRWDLNGTWSKNRIKDYVNYISDVNEDYKYLYTLTTKEIGNTPIAFSPSFIGNSIFTIDYNNFHLGLQSQYVSKQYLDNLGLDEDSIDAYFVHHLNLDYSFKALGDKNWTVGLNVYNLFNTKYETNGYSQTAAVYKDSSKKEFIGYSHDPRFYPMAGTNVLAHLTLRF